MRSCAVCLINYFDNVIATTLDPEGRRVVLGDDVWNHVKRRHPVLAPRLREIMAAVREPARRSPGREEGEEWYFSSEAGTHLWIQVVVPYEGGEGWIVTAFPREPLRRR
jgi:hypothetical protein